MPLAAQLLEPRLALAADDSFMQFVTVGDAGNAADTDPAGFGAVANEYRIGKYEVTIGQYTKFLNAVAKTDTYDLYNTSMGTDLNIAGISRSGSPGSYTYAVMNNGGDSSNRPITYVSWFDAARFANWMHNGQLAGAQNASTTEDGAYALNGATSGTAPAKNSVARFYIPTENEWYKAAYYKGGSTNAGYWNYATRSNAAPGNVVGGGANQANYFNGVFSVTQSSFFLESQNYLTDVGAFTNSVSQYGTFDQSGSVFEWHDLTGAADIVRGFRGGLWQATFTFSGSSSHKGDALSPFEAEWLVGFRLASPVTSPVGQQELVINSVVPSATGGVDVTVSTVTQTAKLTAATPIALFWAGGPRFDNRSGGAFYQTVLPKGFSGSRRIHVSANEFASDPRLGFAGSGGSWDTHLLVKVNPLVNDDNVKAMALKRIVLGKDFKATEDGVSVDSSLLEKVRQLTSRLIGRNLVTSDITLNEAIRSPQRAHRWSTARLILTSPASGSAAILRRLQALPGGRDADGNPWYDKDWEKGLSRTKAGALTTVAVKTLWAKVQANARSLVSDRSNPTADAAEGYAPNDVLKRYLPNIARGVSNHVSGKAIDISIPWRKGAEMYSGVVSTGETSDKVASQIVAGFGLKRPVRLERWHFELA